MRNFIFRIVLIIIVNCLLSVCYSQQTNYFYSGGAKRYFVQDSTSINIIVADSTDIETIYSKLKTIFNANSDTIDFCDEDDNIIIKSNNLSHVNMDVVIDSITNNHPEKISFHSYASISNGHRFWLRNLVISKLIDYNYYPSIQNIINNNNVDSVWLEDSLYLYALCTNMENLITLCNSIYESGYVSFSEPDYYYQYNNHFNDPFYNNQFYLNNSGQTISSICVSENCIAGIDIKAEYAWNFISHINQSYIPNVAVIDDGVEDHEDLYAGTISKVSSGFPSSNHGRPLSGNAHGECCAGIIAATPNNNKGIVGVSPTSWIVPIRIQKKGGTFMSNTRIARGIRKSWNEFLADILNNSWGSIGLSSDVIIDAYITAATEGRSGKGCVVIASSGNDYSSSNINFIGNINQVIAVGGIKGNGVRGEYSNYSSALNLVAIGGSVCYAPGPILYGTIRTIDREGNNGYSSGNYYEYFGMTSAAAPQVSGVAALMLSVNSNLTSAQVKSILEQTAYKLPNYTFNANGWNQEVGYGLVDAHKAVVYAYEYGYNKRIVGADTLSSCNVETYSCDILRPDLFTYHWTVSSNLSVFPNEDNTAIIVPRNTGPATISVNVYSQNRLMFTFYKTIYVSSALNMDIVPTQTISENTTWSGVKYLPTTLTIDTIRTLTITGTLYCAPAARIIIRPGGKLIVNGGTLTNACDGEMWEGIIVEGNTNLRQAALAQGSVILNNATIENAHTAISTHRANDSIWVGTGGIVQATNSLFRNNRRTAEFLLYENHLINGSVTDNISHFTRCTFTIDNDNLFAANNTSFYSHATLWGVRGVRFNGCTFRNDETASTGTARGNAILSDEAGFIAQRVCHTIGLDPCYCEGTSADPVTRCTFTGFHEAVNASNTDGSYDITIDNCDFAQNQTCVALNAADNARVSFCDFNLNGNYIISAGVSLNNSTGYTVEDNALHKQSVTNGPLSFGIMVGNSGTAENVIRKNEFTNLNGGCYALGDNATLNVKPARGLQFECNSYNGCNTDIFVQQGGRIRNVQGSSTAGADNDFQNTQNSSLYVPSTNAVIYWYSNTIPHIPYNPSTRVTPKSTAAANSCQSSLCGSQLPPTPPPGPRGEALSQYRAMGEEYAVLVADARNASLQTDADDPQDIDTTALQMRLSDLSAAMGDMARTAIRAILSDTVVDMGLLKEWYGTIVETRCITSLQTGQPTDLPVEAYQLAEAYNTEGDYAAADALLASLPQRFNPDEPSRNEYGNYLNLQRLRENVAGNWYRQTAAEIADLQQVAEYDNGRAARMAKEILCFFHHICYEDELLLPEWDGGAAGERNQGGDAVHHVSTPTTTDNSDGLRLHPNPANTTLTVESDSPVREITVYDLTGRTVTVETCHGASLQQTINTTSLPAGIYLLRAVTDNGMKTARFVKN